MFDQLHQGNTSTFTLKLSQSCKTCFNVRLLKVRTTSKGVSLMPSRHSWNGSASARKGSEKYRINWTAIVKAWLSLAKQPQVQTKLFAIDRKNRLDAGINTNGSISSMIFFPFFCACAYVYVCTATSENEHKDIYHVVASENTGSRVPRAWTADGSDVFASACVCVWFRFHLRHPYIA